MVFQLQEFDTNSNLLNQQKFRTEIIEKDSSETFEKNLFIFNNIQEKSELKIYGFLYTTDQNPDSKLTENDILFV